MRKPDFAGKPQSDKLSAQPVQSASGSIIQSAEWNDLNMEQRSDRQSTEPFQPQKGPIVGLSRSKTGAGTRYRRPSTINAGGFKPPLQMPSGLRVPSKAAAAAFLDPSILPGYRSSKRLLPLKSLPPFTVERQFPGVEFSNARLKGIKGTKSAILLPWTKSPNFIWLSKQDIKETDRAENKTDHQDNALASGENFPFQSKRNGHVSLANSPPESNHNPIAESELNVRAKSDLQRRDPRSDNQNIRNMDLDKSLNRKMDRELRVFDKNRGSTNGGGMIVHTLKAGAKADRKAVSILGHPYVDRNIRRVIKQPIYRTKRDLIGINTGLIGSNNDLIFGHGNSPIFVGIPPVYPGAKKT